MLAGGSYEVVCFHFDDTEISLLAQAKRRREVAGIQQQLKKKHPVKVTLIKRY